MSVVERVSFVMKGGVIEKTPAVAGSPKPIAKP
jgi:hypothetical protein